METLHNPPLTPDLITALVEIWTTVSNAGGAVGFVGPITAVEVGRDVDHFWTRVGEGSTDLVVATDAGRPVGFGFLSPAQDTHAAPHRAEVQKLQRDPAARGAGIGALVLGELEACAERRGLSLVTVTVRSGTGREAFYLANGYQVVARLPGWLEVEGTATDELVLAKPLPPPLPLPPPSQISELGVDGAPKSEIWELGRGELGRGELGGLVVPVKRLDPDLPLPTYARPGDAGLDLMAREDRVLPAGMRCLMPTGIAVAIPDGYVGLVHPRSGLAVRQGLSVINTPGTIDAGYRGELKVPLVNHDRSVTVRITRGERIAQLLIQAVEHARLVEVDELPEGIRGEGGFGSTGR